MSQQVVLKKKPPKDSIVVDEDAQEIYETVGKDLGQFHELGVSFLNREIYLGEITHGSSIRFHKNLLALENISGAPIKIHIHSPGGLVEAGWGVYDIMLHSRCEIVGIGWGVCASMAALILQGCDKRILAPNCTFMLHEGSDSLHDTSARNPMAYGLEAKRHLILMYEILERNSFLSINQLEQLISHIDLFLTPKEVVALGLADKILKAKDLTRNKKGVDKKSLNRIIAQKSFSKLFK